VLFVKDELTGSSSSISLLVREKSINVEYPENLLITLCESSTQKEDIIKLAKTTIKHKQKK
jgi:hypothetical protein